MKLFKESKLLLGSLFCEIVRESMRVVWKDIFFKGFKIHRYLVLYWRSEIKNATGGNLGYTRYIVYIVYLVILYIVHYSQWAGNPTHAVLYFCLVSVVLDGKVSFADWHRGFGELPGDRKIKIIKFLFFVFCHSNYASCYEGSETENTLSAILKTCSPFFLSHAIYVLEKNPKAMEKK